MSLNIGKKTRGVPLEVSDYQDFDARDRNNEDGPKGKKTLFLKFWSVNTLRHEQENTTFPWRKHKQLKTF